MPASAFEPALGKVTEELRRCTIQVLAGDDNASGSGVVISRGMAVTNAHVVRGATEAAVRLWNGDLVRASIDRVDRRRDLALLGMPECDSAYAVLRDSQSVRAGELAVAVGSPFGFIGAVSIGVVRGLGPVPGLDRRDWIQADVRLAPGNSGGPLADVHGRVTGINTMIANGIGLAAPANAVQQFLNAKAPFRLGVTARPIALPTGMRGVMILQLETGGAAERASLIPGDVLVGVDDIAVRSVEDLADALGCAGNKVYLRFIRGGQDRIRQTTGVAA
jgi:serine protease Do